MANSSHGSGSAVVPADLSVTISCDCEGVFSLAQAHREAAVTGAELWLVGMSAGVKRTLSMLGLDDVLPIYPSLEAAQLHESAEH